MAEEDKTGLQTDENTEQKADSQTEKTGTPEKTEVKDETNWEQRHKDLQADHTRKSQRLAEAEARITELEQPPEEPPEDDDADAEQFVDRKAVGKMINDAVLKERSANRMERGDSYFRRTYPELVNNENVISGIMRNPTDPKMAERGITVEERIDSAVKEFHKLTEDAVETAKTEAETKAKERDEKNRKATGLGGPSTTPSKSDDEGKSDADDLKDRKARLAKKRNLA